MKPIKILFALACLLGFAAALQAQTCNANVPATTPTSEFTDSGDGTVTHTRTGLMWKRCAEGQTWAGGTCTGTAGAYNWAGALLAGRAATDATHTDWRLPNVKELESIVEGKCYSPSINASIFPNTSASGFWSASANAHSSSSAWYVRFGYGDAYYGYKGGSVQVRLVRAGQSFGVFDRNDTVPLSVSKTGAGSIVGGPVNCGSTCTGNAGRGFDVTLTAVPAANLTAWGGACASAGAAPTCTVNMDMAKTVSATFAEAPIALATPVSLGFAAQNVGSSSATQAVMLSNSGTTTLNIGSLSASGDFALVPATTTCGSTLAVGGSCSISVRFTPTAAGARTGSVNLVSNAPGSPQSLVALSGTGQGGLLWKSTSSLFFSSRYTGTSSTPNKPASQCRE